MGHDEDPVRLFLKSCLGLIHDKHTLEKLHRLLDNCAQDTMPDKMDKLTRGEVCDESVRNIP